jgi:hypothetical protein
MQKNIAACMPHDQVVKQWKESFVSACAENKPGDDKFKAYCECAADKAASTWTNEQLMDEQFNKDNIESVSADCPKP